MSCRIILRLNRLARWAAGLLFILTYVGVVPEVWAEEQWQYAETRRIDIEGLTFAHTRPVLYLSFSYRGTDGTYLTPPTVVGIDLESGSAISDVLPCGSHAKDPVLSPDDAYLAYRFYDRAHLIGLRRLADGETTVLPDRSPGIRYPQFFSPDSKFLSYRIGEDPEDRNYDRRSETVLAEYSLDTGKRTTWPLGVRGAWDLQRLSDDRVIFRAIEPTNKEITQRFARRERDVDRFYSTGLIYTFDKSTGATRLDPVNELSTYFRQISPYRTFSFFRVTKDRRYYLVDNGYRAADFVAADQGKLTQFPPLAGDVLDFDISDDEKWLAYVYADWSDSRPRWQYSERDEDLGIRNMVTGETRRVDLREPPFSDIANRQWFGCTSGPVAWLGSPPFDDVAPEPPLVSYNDVRLIVLGLMGLATLAVWVGAGVVAETVWGAMGLSVMGTLILGMVFSGVLADDFGHDTLGQGVALAITSWVLLFLLPLAAICSAAIASDRLKKRAPRAPGDGQNAT